MNEYCEFSMKLNEETDLINFTKTSVNMSQNTNTNTNANGFWKYNEDKILKQLEEYIAGSIERQWWVMAATVHPINTTQALA